FYSLHTMRFLGSFLFLLFVTLTVQAQTPAPVADAHAISGSEIISGDNRVLHLAGIAPPFAEDEDHRNQAQKQLQNLITGHAPVFEDAAADRYGRLNAQAYILDASGKKIWLQEEMLKSGLAFVYPPTGTEDRLEDMRVIEAKARQTHVGIWADPLYAD